MHDAIERSGVKKRRGRKNRVSHKEPLRPRPCGAVDVLADALLELLILKGTQGSKLAGWTEK
jgi:hypothetical protein